MFYSKTKLKALGWSDADIAALPDRIKTGDFTLDDLIATAKEAVDKGIVEKGFGYWHRNSKGGDFIQYYAAYGAGFTMQLRTSWSSRRARSSTFTSSSAAL